MKFIPYKQHCNLLIDPSMLSGQNKRKDERVYAFACFLPQGKYNSVLLHPQEEKKNAYSLILKA